jgi:hypothetical protein
MVDVLPDAMKWRKFLAGWDKQLPIVTVTSSTPWIAAYLFLRNHSGIKPAELTVLAAMKLPGKLPATFHSEWYELLARKLEQADHLDEAANAWKLAAQSARQSVKPYLLLNRDRVLYARHALK